MKCSRYTYCIVAVVLLLVIRIIAICTTAWNADYAKHKFLAREPLKSPAKIPAILHHTWKDDNIPDDWKHIQKHCYDIHPKYQRMLWTDKSSRELIASDFPWFLSTYDSYWYDIQRADAIRYFVLFKYGGIYLDLDVGCRKNLNPFLPYTFLIPETSPVGYSNDVMMSVPNHQFLAYLISSLRQWNYLYGTKYLTVFFSTGPAFVSYHLNCYLARLESSSQNRPAAQSWNTFAVPASSLSDIRQMVHFSQDLTIIDHVLYSNNKEFSFFYHVEGSSWHSWDVKIVNGLWAHKDILCMVLVVVTGCWWKIRKELFE